MNQPVYLTIDQAAERANFSRAKIKKYLADAGWIRIGRQWRILTTKFDAWMDSGEIAGTTQSQPRVTVAQSKTQVVENTTVSHG